MTVQQDSKAVVRQLFAAIDSGDKAAFMAVMHPDFKLEFTGVGKVLDREGHWQMALGHKAVYSDMKHTPELQIAEGNQVFTRGTITGTNDGSFRGHPPTGRKIQVKFMNFCTLHEGKIIAIESLFDSMAEYEQLLGKVE